MSSPFPGIDPYIEAQDYWQDFHTRFLTYACDAINDDLPSGYVAQLGERLRLVEMPVRGQKRVPTGCHGRGRQASGRWSEGSRDGPGRDDDAPARESAVA